jgi:rod shape-determining protein MreD
MIRAILWALVILGGLLILQSTVLAPVALFGAKPQLLLLVFVVLATQNGSWASQIVGFVLGFAIDMVTTAPLGFHAFQFALAGYLFGLGSGKVYLDPVILPALLGLLATLFDTFSGFLLNTVFNLGQPITAFFNLSLLFQCLLNVILAPAVFLAYGWVKQRFQNPRRGFGG